MQVNNVVITGASGFLGKRLVRSFLSLGFKVYAVGRTPLCADEYQQSLLENVYCPMENLRDLPRQISNDVTHFIHLAWEGSTGKERGDTELQLKNVKFTLDAVRAAKELGCKRFIGAGTLAELDALAYIPFDGSTPNLVSNYASAKLCAHFMSKALCNSLGTDHIWAIISNTYGPGNFTNNFVNFAVTELLKKGSGEFTSGEQYYDFVYVDDTVEGLLKACLKGTPNFSYYIGSGEPKRLKYFIEEIRQSLDPKIPIHLGAIPFNGISHPKDVFDCRKLVEHTDYQPHFSFKEGLALTIPWIKDNLLKDVSKKI